MPYVAPSTVVAGQSYASSAHNIIVNDIIDHESRIATVQNTQYPFRNVLVNGDFQISQRGTSVSGITSGTSYYSVDRWNLAVSAAGTYTHASSADAPTGSGFRNSLRVTCSATAASAAASYAYVQQRLEGQTLQHIKKGTSSAQQLTLSFWAKSNKTGTYIAGLEDNDNTRIVSGSYSISVADTWEQKTITFPADTTGAFDNDNAYSLALTFWLTAGTNYTSGSLATTWAATTAANQAVGQTYLGAVANQYLAITGVQLEPGSVASPFEFVRYDDSLRRCQRYYYRFTNTQATSVSFANGWVDNAALTAYVYVPFPVQMRSNVTGVEASASTTLAVSGVASGGNTTVTFQEGNTNGCRVKCAITSALTTGYAIMLFANQNGYVGFTGAEL